MVIMLVFLNKPRSDLLNIIGYNYKQMKETEYLWPIVDFRVKYLRPIVLQQSILVEASLIEYENRLKIKYFIYDVHTKEILTKAESITGSSKKKVAKS